MASCQSTVDNGRRLTGCMSAFNKSVWLILLLKTVFNSSILQSNLEQSKTCIAEITIVMTFRKTVFHQISKELTDYDRFVAGEIKIIGYPGFERSDTVAANVMSYSSWIQTYKNFPVIKVEGLESKQRLLKLFREHSPKNIHLFYSQCNSESFNWHTDDVNVFLYVVRGFKIVKFRNKNKVIRSGEGTLIPKGREHKVYSKRGTWALSIGF